MRIDSLTYFNTSLNGMRDNQSGIARLTQQLAADRKLLQPKDDPVATEQVLDLSNRVAVRTQFASNQDRASLALKYETTVLSEMQSTLEGARALLAGVSSSHDAGYRESVAQRLSGFSQQLLDLANTRDPSGNYIFGGHDTDDAPYDNPLDGTATATTYDGTPIGSLTDPAGTRNIEIGPGRYVQINDNLNLVFQASEQDDLGGAIVGSVIDPAANPDVDLLQQMDEAVAKLANDTAPPTDAELSGWMTRLDSALTELMNINYRVAAAYGEVGDVRATSKSLMVQEQNALTDIQALDKEAAIMELQLRQTTLEATQRAYAKISGLSLFNFL
jgi:flagellar hook-associated protein 3 FlgL